MLLSHLASRIIGTPLLIARPKLDVILSVLGSRIGLPETDMALPMPAPKITGTALPTGIAVIPVIGTLVKQVMGIDAASGLMSYDEIGARLDAALADPKIAGILLDMDSPGGEAGGVFELAARIRAASQIKPVWAHANDAAYSAAYAIAAASERLTLSQTAGVGSIGVIALHVDQSIKDAKDGLNYTAIFAGGHKNDYSPHEALTPQATTALQSEVDRLYAIFTAQVAAMRGLDRDAVRATEAGVFFGEHAVAAGLAEAVMPFDQVLTEFADVLAAKRRLATPQATRSAAIPSVHSNLENAMNNDEKIEHLEPVGEQTDIPTNVAPSEDPPITGGAPQSEATARTPIAQLAAIGRIEAQAIAELCLIAGQPQRTAEFLASGASEAQVRRALLEARADQPEITSRITTDTGTGTTLRPEDSPVVAAVKKLTNKE
jgi:signal peptide peptidase SppA